MSPIPAAAPTPPPAPPVDPWAWLEGDPPAATRLDKYVVDNKLGDRAAALLHITRIYLKVK